jgi:hypothetical protein
MINFETWLKQVEYFYGVPIVNWMIPFAKTMFEDSYNAIFAAEELYQVWLDHNND